MLSLLLDLRVLFVFSFSPGVSYFFRAGFAYLRFVTGRRGKMSQHLGLACDFFCLLYRAVGRDFFLASPFPWAYSMLSAITRCGCRIQRGGVNFFESPLLPFHQFG